MFIYLTVYYLVYLNGLDRNILWKLGNTNILWFFWSEKQIYSNNYFSAQFYSVLWVNLWFVDWSWRQWLEGVFDTKSAQCVLLHTSAVPALELSMITGLKICARLRSFHQRRQLPGFHWKTPGQNSRDSQTCSPVPLSLMWLCILLCSFLPFLKRLLSSFRTAQESQWMFVMTGRWLCWCLH